MLAPLTEDVLKSSEIEGKHLDKVRLQSHFLRTGSGAGGPSFEIDVPAQLASDRPFEHHLFETFAIIVWRVNLDAATIALPKTKSRHADAPMRLLYFEGSTVHLNRLE